MSKSIKERWAFHIVCRDCNTIFEVENPDCSLERTPGFGRLVLLHVPEVCPECKNLKVVE